VPTEPFQVPTDPEEMTFGEGVVETFDVEDTVEESELTGDVDWFPDGLMDPEKKVEARKRVVELKATIRMKKQVEFIMAKIKFDGKAKEMLLAEFSPEWSEPRHFNGEEWVGKKTSELAQELLVSAHEEAEQTESSPEGILDDWLIKLYAPREVPGYAMTPEQWARREAPKREREEASRTRNLYTEKAMMDTLTERMETVLADGEAPYMSQESCVHYHNLLRAKHGLPPVVWDDALAADAQKACDRVINGPRPDPDVGLGLLFHSNYTAGQNAFGSYNDWQPGSGSTHYTRNRYGTARRAGFASYQGAIESWYREGRFYNYEDQCSLQSDEVVGHFTQVLGDFTKVGMAYQLMLTEHGSASGRKCWHSQVITFANYDTCQGGEIPPLLPGEAPYEDTA